MEQSKILSRILSVRTDKHQENVSQVTRSRGGGLNVGSPKYEAGILSTGPRYSINSVDHTQIYVNSKLRDIKFYTLACMSMVRVTLSFT